MNKRTNLIADLTSYSFQPFFKNEGYKRANSSFIKKEDAIIKIVNFWRMRSNFTISLGIFFPEISQYMIPRHIEYNPKRAADCHVQQQNLGLLSEKKRATWWSLYEKGHMVDLQILSKEVFDVFINFGMPWLDECNNYSQALVYLLNEKAGSLFPPFVIPALYLILGEKKEAQKSLKNIYNDYKNDYSKEALKDYGDALVNITKEHNEFSDINNLDVKFYEAAE